MLDISECLQYWPVVYWASAAVTCLSAFEWPEWDFGVLRLRVWDFVTDRERFLDFTLATDAGDFDDYLPGTATSTPCP